ncbi:MAG: DeoR family transcriptional regulator, partial [Bacteriovorax sp.]
SLLETDKYKHEDLFHEFLMSLENAPDPVRLILESGYWSLLYKYIDISRGKDALYVELEKNIVITFSDKKIESPKTGLTPLDFKLLFNIVGGANTKAELCKRVWGHEYDPYRHDTMIYTAISSLRKNLGYAGSWIETTEKGYAFNDERIFKVKDDLSFSSPKRELSLERKNLLNLASGLNLRQMKILSHLKKSEFIDVNECKKLFKISDITASRDLRALKESGLVISVGKARATKYMLSGSHYEN